MLSIEVRAEIASFDHEVDYVTALRKRGLHRLAALQCEQLASLDLSATQRVGVNVQLSKTLTDHALNSRSPQREELWQQATGLLQKEIGLTQEPASRVLLELQLGLTMLEQAAWSRRESEIRAANDEDWLPARAQIRAAIKQLKAVEESLTELKRRSAGRDANLSSSELAELQRNTNYALARAYRNQAISYSTNSTSDANTISNDQVSALTQALKYLDPLANDTVVDEVVWKSRLDRIECFRLRRQLKSARRLILEATEEETTADVTARLAAEGVRLALATNQLDAALKLVREHGDNRQPELDLARVETLVAVAKQKGIKEGEAYRTEATEIAARLDREHGTYWGMRGEILIAKLSERLISEAIVSGSNFGDSTDTTDATSLLETAAKTLLKQGRPDEAIDTFLRAAKQAQANRRPRQAFDFLFKAAVIHQQEGQLQSAVTRFREAANSYPNEPRAGEAHLLAVFQCATLYQHLAKDDRKGEANKQLSLYDELLQEHLRMWSTNPSADQARLWYGRLLEAQGKYKLALEAYRDVSPGSNQAAESYQRLGGLYHKLFAQGVEDTVNELSNARAWFRERLQLEDDANASQALTKELASLCFLSPPDYELAQQILDRAIESGLPDSKETGLKETGSVESDKSLDALRLVAVAGTDAATARIELAQLMPLPRDSLTAILTGLQPIRDASPEDVELMGMAKDCIKFIQPYSNQLTDQHRLLIQQFTLDGMQANQAIEGYRRLAAEHPKHRRIQLRYAELAAMGRDRAAREEALNQWRKIVTQSKARSPEWFRAKLGVAQAYFDKGEHDKSKQMVELLMTLYPELGGAKLERRFQELLQRIQRNAF